MSSVLKDGWMTKQGGFIKTWKKRWFVLEGTMLSYYVKPDGKMKGQIDISASKVISTAPECRRQPAFKINIPGVRTYYIVPKTPEEVREWITELEKVRDAKGVPEPVKTVSLQDFEIIRCIGKGSYGIVQLVRNKNDGQLYAMKTMSKQVIAEYQQVDQAITERNVLLRTVHPFLVSAHFSFQSPTNIFLILDYIPGGELFNRLKEEIKFNEARTRLYAAEILLGIGHLHSLGFIYRDLKPENILVDAEGHLKITDFGLVKTDMKSDTTTQTMCGTPEYLAPEMIQQQPYTMAVDWWSFGVLVYEMLVGLPPFYNKNASKMYRAILSSEVGFPPGTPEDAKDLITKLLEKDPAKRLGSGPDDYIDIKRHRWFDDIDWDAVLERRTEPEWRPIIESETDTSNFEAAFTENTAQIDEDDEKLIPAAAQSAFVNFTAVSPQVAMQSME